MNTKELKLLKSRIVRVCRVHFYLALALAIQIMVYDAWQLIQPEAVLQRWVVTAALFVATTIVWLLARSPSTKALFYHRLVAGLIVADTLAASYLVYQTRGMASRAVLLYAFPIIIAALLKSRIALLATAFFSIAAYTTTTVAYFVLNFNEGYKIELYGEVGFYSTILVLLASLLWAVVNSSAKE